jgi:thiol-disulfide isomerase/thioredoxin
MRPARSAISRNIGLIFGAVVLAGALLAIDSRQPAPAFSGKTLDGEKFNNDTLKGQVILIQFWATWCGFCRRDQPAVDTIVQEFSGKGLTVLAVDVGESKRTVTRYLQENPRACKVVLMEDTNLAARFRSQGFPHYVVIDAEGKIAGEQRGAAGAGALLRLLAKAGLKGD